MKTIKPGDMLNVVMGHDMVHEKPIEGLALVLYVENDEGLLGLLLRIDVLFHGKIRRMYQHELRLAEHIARLKYLREEVRCR